jgi:class 3 adenylate cyclase
VLTMPDPDIQGESTKASQVIVSLAFRFLVAVDIEGFSRRSAAAQAKMQDDLEHAMFEAAAQAGLDRNCWYRQLGGDGELAVLPADTNSLSLVADYPRNLALVLAEINGPSDPGSRLRVRMAIHHGTVFPGRFGPVGVAPITVSRLVDAQVLRHALKQRSDLDIALIVSTAVYDEVVKSGFNELDPNMFHRTNIRIKGTYLTGYPYDGSFIAAGPEVSSITSMWDGAVARTGA